MLQNIQIGLDLATALSIIGAATIFIGQFTKDRRSRRSNEMWTYFKQVTDDISKYKSKYASALMNLHYITLNETTQTEITKTTDDIFVTTDEFAFHIKYFTQAKLENLLIYYQIDERLRKEILELIEKLLEDIAIYQGDLQDVTNLCSPKELSIDAVEAVRGVLVRFTISEEYAPISYQTKNAAGDLVMTETKSKQNIAMILDEFNHNFLNKIIEI